MLQIRHLKEHVFAYPMEGGALTGAAEYGYPEPPAPEAFILLGDFNMVQGSPEYVRDDGRDGLFRRPSNRRASSCRRLYARQRHAVRLCLVDRDETLDRNRLIDYAFLHASLRTAWRRAGSILTPAARIISRSGWSWPARSLHPRPRPEADPGLAVQVVPLDRNLASHDRVQHALAGILEAALVDHAPGGGIDHATGNGEHIDRRCPEGEIDQRMRGFRRISMLPVRLSDPVAEFQAAASRRSAPRSR